MISVDNVDAAFVASNITTTSHTKQVDIKYNYLNEYIEDRIVKIIFVESADNDSNILTKNFKCRASWEAFKEDGGWGALRCSQLKK